MQIPLFRAVVLRQRARLTPAMISALSTEPGDELHEAPVPSFRWLLSLLGWACSGIRPPDSGGTCGGRIWEADSPAVHAHPFRSLSSLSKNQRARERGGKGGGGEDGEVPEHLAFNASRNA